MKKIVIIILLTVIITNGFCLKALAVIQGDTNHGTAINKNEAANPAPSDNLAIAAKKDSVLDLKGGENGLRILESLESSAGTEINIKSHSDKDEWYRKNNDYDHPRRKSRFRGHWAGIEFGLNNYVTSNGSFSMPDDINYMTLNSGKSSNFNLNFTQLSVGLARHIGFVTGLGLNWNNYRFNGNNNIQSGPNGVIEDFVPGVDLEKSKLATIYLTLPFLLEIQLPAENNRLYIAAGPIGALKLSSHNKIVYECGPTTKSWSDFSLNMLRGGATARIGYGNFLIYGTYYYTPLFQSGKGPGGYDLYPFEIGIALAFNN